MHWFGVLVRDTFLSGWGCRIWLPMKMWFLLLQSKGGPKIVGVCCEVG